MNPLCINLCTPIMESAVYRTVPRRRGGTGRRPFFRTDFRFLGAALNQSGSAIRDTPT